MWNLLTAGSDFVSDSLLKFAESTGVAGFFTQMGWGSLAMIGVAFFLMYLAIRHKFEPLLLFTIAFGMLLTNLPGANLYHTELFAGGHVHWDIFVANAGLLDYLYLGVKLGIYPCLIFVGVGAMTDFGPLIANPKSFLLGAAAQIGIFATFLGAYALGFTPTQAGSIGIIGGADGPTAIYLTSMLSPELLGPIAVAAYSYMALVPVIQPPIMRLLTTEKERKIKMQTLRPVSKLERILFPLVIAVIISLLLPSAAPLIGCLMLGNLMKECGVVDRLSKTVHLPRSDGRRYGYGRGFLEFQDVGNPRAGRRRFLHGYRRRSVAGQVDELLLQGGQQDQSVDRFGRRFGRADGRPRLADRGSESRSVELPADARHGPQCGRCRGFGRGRGHSAFVPGLEEPQNMEKSRKLFRLFSFSPGSSCRRTGRRVRESGPGRCWTQRTARA